MKRILDALCSEEDKAASREEPSGAVPGDAGAGAPQPGAAYDLTVVIPTRNERDNILPLLQGLRAALDGIRAEMLFVDDSDDDTPLIIKDASALETSLFHVHVEHRQPGVARAEGLATAVIQGMHRAQAEYVAVLDADLQHPKAAWLTHLEQAVNDIPQVYALLYHEGGPGLDPTSAEIKSWSLASDPDSLAVMQSIVASLHKKAFDLIQLNYGYDTQTALLISHVIEHSKKYDLIDVIPFRDSYGTGHFWIWRKH